MREQSHADADVRSPLGLPERYEPLRHIATGGMASVWCARDRALGRSVAIKLMAEPLAAEPGGTERFMREARAAARLSGHPNVVMIYDVGETDPSDRHPPRAFIVMEYLAGGTVADALRVDSVRRVHAVKWIHEAASALDYGHSRGVLHRDIKPANLLLDRDRVLHVADFGIARLATEDTITGSGQVLGTASYLAPERALGRPATEASDRYSLAVAAFELLVGERPFTATHFGAQARQHVEDEPPAASSRNRTLPPGVDAVLARGMAKRPTRRWPTAQDFAQALEAALSDPATRSFRGAGGAAVPGTRGARAAASRKAAAGRGRAAAAGVAGAAPAPERTTPTAADPPERRRRLRGGRVAAIAALAAGAGVAVAIAGSVGSGGQQAAHTSLRAQRPTTNTTTATTTATHRAPPAKPKPAPAPHPTNTVTATSAAATTPAPVSDTLEARGHQLMLNGDYAAAVPVLRQAVSSASPSSATYAYALYDLGRSLRLAGDPKSAVGVLYQRLQIPDQTETVRLQLQLALQALGQQVRGGGAAPTAGPSAPGAGGHRNHHNRTGGAAAGPAGAAAPPTQG